jgi:hypothetical protein
VPEEERKLRAARDAPVTKEIEAIQGDPAYKTLLEGAAAEKRDTFEAVFDLSSALSRVDATAWKHSLKTDGVSVRLLMEPKPVKKLKYPVVPSQPDEDTQEDTQEDISDEDPGAKRARKSPAKKPKKRRVPRGLPAAGILTVERLREGLQKPDDDADAKPAHRLDEANLTTNGALKQNAVLNTELERLFGGPLPIAILGADPGMWELLVVRNPDLVYGTHKERQAAKKDVLESGGKSLPPDTARYTLKQRRSETTPGQYFLKKRQRENLTRLKRFQDARAYRHAHRKPPDVVAADRTLSAENSKGPTATALLAYCRARSAVLPTALPWYTHTERRHMHWKAFIEEQRSFSNFCNRIRALAPIRQPGENAQLVIAYGAFGTSSGMGIKGLPPCIGKGLLLKISRHFLVVVVPEHYTSKRCMHCGSECGNHSYLAERDRRAQTDDRLEARLRTQLERAETPAQRASARQHYDRAMGRPCEIRGLRFCNGCTRCLNRDANSAPQMAVQLKRLLLGMGPLYKRSKQEEEVDKLDNATGI